jgi:hypothetical protein
MNDAAFDVRDPTPGSVRRYFAGDGRLAADFAPSNSKFIRYGKYTNVSCRDP